MWIFPQFHNFQFKFDFLENESPSEKTFTLLVFAFGPIFSCPLYVYRGSRFQGGGEGPVSGCNFVWQDWLESRTRQLSKLPTARGTSLPPEDNAWLPLWLPPRSNQLCLAQRAFTLYDVKPPSRIIEPVTVAQINSWFTSRGLMRCGNREQKYPSAVWAVSFSMSHRLRWNTLYYNGSFVD